MGLNYYDYLHTQTTPHTTHHTQHTTHNTHNTMYIIKQYNINTALDYVLLEKSKKPFFFVSFFFFPFPPLELDDFLFYYIVKKNITYSPNTTHNYTQNTYNTSHITSAHNNNLIISSR